MAHVEESRSRIILDEYEILNTSPLEYPGTYYGANDAWNFEDFKKKFKIKIMKLTDLEMEFDIIGVDPSIPNAFRRILLSDVPTMAIEKVFIYNNTSIIQDEVLAHRLGLIPLRADPRLFELRQEGDDKGSPEDTLEFELKIKCTWDPARAKDATDPDTMYRDLRAYSSHIKWIPLGNQAELHTAESVGPVHDDILIAKLRPGHELDIKLHAVKSVGRDHAKFSPVATAFYRLLPEVKLLRRIEGEAAERLVSCFSPGVIELVEENGKKVAQVKDARYDTISRNVFRHEDLKDAVRLTRIKDHFIFSIESTGALKPDVLFTESIKVLASKCRTLLAELDSEV